jgi:hypothetical protein
MFSTSDGMVEHIKEILRFEITKMFYVFVEIWVSLQH